MAKVIYIKNPKQGSHFRTIGSNASAKKSASKSPKTSTAPVNNGFIAGMTDAFGNPLFVQNKIPTRKWDWKTRSYITPKPNNPYAGMNFNNPNITTPHGPTFTNFGAQSNFDYMMPAQFYAIRWQTTGLGTALYDIARGYDPVTGSPININPTAGSYISPLSDKVVTGPGKETLPWWGDSVYQNYRDGQ